MRSPVQIVTAAVLLLVTLSLAACTDQEPELPQPLDLSTAVLSEPRSAPLGRTSFLPVIAAGTRQARWIEIDDQVCVRSLVPGEADKTCASFVPDTTIDLPSLHWTSDGATVLYNENGTQLSGEPDIWSLTAASGELQNLADDASPSSSDDAALRDLMPFAASDGSVHYFQIRPDSTTLWKHQATGVPQQLPLALEWFVPTHGVHRVGPDQFLVPSTAADGTSSPLWLLDLAELSISEVPVPGIVFPTVVTSGPNSAIVADASLQAIGQSPYVFVRFAETSGDDTWRTTLLNMPLVGRPNFAISPTDDSFVVAGRSAEGQALQLLGFTWQASGDLSSPLMIAPQGFAPGINSSPTDQSLVWTDDNQLLMLNDVEALVFDLTNPPAE